MATILEHKYQEFLDGLVNILGENNPAYQELLDEAVNALGDKHREVFTPPIVRKGINNNKTLFVNFMDTCERMRRESDHVMKFLLTEMGTSGSLNAQQRLVVNGRYVPSSFEGILRRYIDEYVICNDCRSPETMLSGEKKSCQQCGAESSVAPIKMVS